MDSGFTPASEYSPGSAPPIDARIIQWQADIVERLDAIQDSASTREIERRLKALEMRSSEAAYFTHDDRQKLTELLNDLTAQSKSLSERVNVLARQIDDIGIVKDRSEQRITDVKGLAKDRIDGLHKEIVDIQILQNVDRKHVNDLAEQLAEVQDLINQHAESINKIWQAAKKTRTPTGKKSLARVEKMKEILKSGPKTYKELERLLDISPKEMNRLVTMLDTRSYEIFFRSGDDRQKVLRLRAWNASQQSKSLTSNVKYSSEGSSKRA